jgi:DNA-binding IclR family transcriptional regulator
MADQAFPIKSLAKALKLLDYISKYEEGTTITELDRNFGFGKSTIHRLLSTLKAGEFVRQAPDTGRYALSYKIFELSHRLEKNTLILRIGRSYLREITRITRETSSLAILDGRNIVYLAKEESLQQLRTSAPEGARLPAHCTALGKALLSDLPDEELEELYPSSNWLKPLTDNSISNICALKRELQEIRGEGIAYDNEEAVKGIRCLAVALKDYTERVVAAVSISMPTQRAASDIMVEYSELLKKKGEELSKELGHTHSEMPLNE